MNEHTHFILASCARGIVGLFGAATSVLMPWQEHLEWGVRVLGALAGVGVAVLTVISLWDGLRNRRKERKANERSAN